MKISNSDCFVPTVATVIIKLLLGFSSLLEELGFPRCPPCPPMYLSQQGEEHKWAQVRELEIIGGHFL